MILTGLKTGSNKANYWKTENSFSIFEVTEQKNYLFAYYTTEKIIGYNERENKTL